MNVEEFMALQDEVFIRYDGVELPGRLAVPEGAEGIVLFAHGSGSSRLSRRNNYVASVLHEAGIATLLFDLLMEPEALDRRNVFDIDLLASRLLLATHWTSLQPALKDMNAGYFGASTGSAAALKASVLSPVPIRAIVSRGGRPDMAADVLERVTAPTLIIVGGNDYGVIELNEEAYRRLRCEKAFEIVPGATHLFEEPGTLERVAELARDWFVRHLRAES
ncbi:dienelactone hydrolase family protein [Nitratifractor salsuginis]|uniref:Phosphoribosyltransferase n=1 Tax=Nitratifractor salsuginis (strain DSM 16511 / JCM 12458 / E9I37-1) TaxID=749222 RepID=E6X2R3_NITSE|nr:DeoR family transcriptional regulator [Nitratifractor salsuginis]ADV46129.1 phosphoribosyltransferase [Nitratifractor salsuginis DSM 16511]